MPDTQPLATHEFDTVPNTLEFLKRTRFELRMLRKVRVYTDKLQVLDINADYFEIQGVGYPQKEIIPLLQAINTAFKPELIHDKTDAEYKEFKTGRRYTWANDRVM